MQPKAMVNLQGGHGFFLIAMKSILRFGGIALALLPERINPTYYSP
jgi:hypothetical protein